MEFWLEDYKFERYKEFLESVGIDLENMDKTSEEVELGYVTTTCPLYKYVPKRNEDNSFVVEFGANGASTPQIKVLNNFTEEYVSKNYSRYIVLSEQEILQKQQQRNYNHYNNNYVIKAWRINTKYKLTLEDLQKILTEKYVEISMDEGLYTLSIPSLDNE